MYIFFFIIFLIFIFNLYFSNLLFWWRTFLLITMVYLFIIKSKGSYSSMINYFIIQEVLGLFFLVFRGTIVQLLILIIKIGVSPFHFWIFSVVYNLDNYIIIWFLTFQKLPFIPVVIYLFLDVIMFFLIFGLIICYFQIFILKNFKLIFLISSTESFNWILFGLLFGIYSYLFVVLYYFINITVLISFLNNINLRFLGLETVYVFLNIPLRVNFFVKLIMLFSSFLYIDLLILFVLLIIFISSLCFIRWLVNYSASSLEILKDNYKNISFIIFYFSFILFFYHFSKNNYIILMWWSSFEMIKR